MSDPRGETCRIPIHLSSAGRSWICSTPGDLSPRIAADLGVTGQTIYNWRNQHLIDTGRREGVTSSDHKELVAARKRIAQLEADLAASQRAVELLKEAVPPKAGRGGRRDGRRVALDPVGVSRPLRVAVDVLR
jgi:transposase-like protein